MAKFITVKSPVGDNYYVLIGSAGLEKLAQNSEGANAERAPKSVVVTNTTVAPLYGEKLARSLPDARLVVIPDGEAYKNLDTVAQLYRDFIAAKLDRNGIVFALGGGVVGDTAGFAAATFMRGVKLVQIPTTLLSMVDSSVGGKVGVDLPEGKNLVGAFKQPDMVMIDTTVLDTLPDREWRCGMAEIIKHGLIGDDRLLDPALHTRENAEELVYRAVQVKVNIVEQDPYEQDIRAHLNLGHTFAHAIEQATHYQVPHGEAVGVGLMAAAILSYNLQLCDSSVPEVVDEMLHVTGLPMNIGSLDPEVIYAAMATDKKFKNGRSRFVLLHGIGQPFIMEDVPKAEVIHVLEQLRDMS